MSDADPMDQRLREYADRWRGAATAPPGVDLERLGSRRHPLRTWWLVAASAAAVAAVILAGTRLVGDDGSRKPPPPAQTVNPTGVVPWAPLPATHPQIPTQTPPPSPDPAEATDKPVCRASDLHATTAGVEGAMGTSYLTAQLELVGTEPCRLEGYPDLQLMDHGRPVDIPLEHNRDDAVYRSPVLVAPGQPASLRLAWGSLWCTAPVHNDTIRLLLDGGYVEYPGFGRSPYCNGTPGSGPTPIQVDTFRPLKTRDAEPHTAYAGVEVAGDLDLTATAGAPLDFNVTLTSPEDLVLDPCPDYRIVQTDAAPHEEAYALNCAAVPYRDGRGRPYLPAGKSVTFAMRPTAGPAGTYKLSWVLDTVDVRGVSGTLTVTQGPGARAPTTRDDALRAALAADPFVRREMIGAPPQGPVECALHVLGSSTSGQILYTWLTCSDFVVANGSATERAGSHEPAVVQVRGSGMDLQIVKVTFPRQQSLAADIKRLFPPSIASHIYDVASTDTSPSSEELKAEAVRDASG